MNPFDLLKNFNIEDFKKISQDTINKLSQMTESGEAGGGFVTIKINGEFKILSIDYEDSELIKNDISTFKNLIILAHNNAVEKMKEKIKKEFSSNFLPGLL